jgi:hypothetical protein
MLQAYIYFCIILSVLFRILRNRGPGCGGLAVGSLFHSTSTCPVLYHYPEQTGQFYLLCIYRFCLLEIKNSSTIGDIAQRPTPLFRNMGKVIVYTIQCKCVLKFCLF